MRCSQSYDPAEPVVSGRARECRDDPIICDADYPESANLNERAIKVEEKLADRDDADLAVIYSNYGDALSKLGRLADAEQAYSSSTALARRTEGEHFGTYWRTLGSHALMLYFSGDRARAMAMLDTMLAAIPADWKANTDDTLARETYAEIPDPRRAAPPRLCRYSRRP